MSKFSLNQWLALAVLALAVVLTFSLIFVIYSVTAESRISVLMEAILPHPTATASPTITNSPTPSPLPSPTLTATRIPPPTSTPSIIASLTVTRTATSTRKTLPTPTRKTTITPTLTPTALARATAPLPVGTITSGARFVSVVGGPPGGAARVTVQTVKGESCSVLFVTTAGAYTTPFGKDKTVADDKGIVLWSWTIDLTAPRGKGTVVVTCGETTIESSLLVE